MFFDSEERLRCLCHGYDRQGFLHKETRLETQAKKKTSLCTCNCEGQ